MRLAFLACHPYQNALLRPIFDGLRARHECQLFNDFTSTVEFNPEIVVQCEGSGTIFELRAKLPRAMIIHLRHGLACKNVAYAAAIESDYTIAPSAWMREWFRSRGASPRRAFWTTGYPPLDPLFQTWRSGERPALPFCDNARPVVLYAPTYNAGLSSIPFLGETAPRLLQPSNREATILIKPHPHTARAFGSWLRAMQSYAARDSRLHVLDAASDLTPYLQNADVLVTDVSSTSLAFLALDRPIVHLTPPTVRGDKYHDATAPEWAWRDMGDEVLHATDLPDALAIARAEPGQHAPRRAHYRELLFGDLDDGRATERVCAHLDALRPSAVRGQWF
jgi:CDP-glycerol glycerophosphotransferase (TagB/SpsB family)